MKKEFPEPLIGIKIITTMKFSIISTFYNNTIQEIEALKNSIVNQTYSKWEWIISDDFSKDSTEHIEYLKSLPDLDKRIKYIEQKTKKEIFWNPQTYATGDIVVLIGGDDTVPPKLLEVYNYHFVKYPELFFVTAESHIFNPNLIISSFIDYKNYGNLFDKRSIFPLGWLNMGVPLAWRNIPIDFTEGFELTGKEIINDWIIHTRLEELGKFTHIPRVFYNYNIRQDSVSRKVDDSNQHSLDTSIVNSVIEMRRKGKKLDSFLSIYDNILNESKAFYYSGLNDEKTCQEVSFISSTELNSHKKIKIRELWIDHNIYFNEINSNIDYYIFYLDEETDLDLILNKAEKISQNPKQILVFSNGNPDVLKISNFMSNHHWFQVCNLLVLIKNFTK